MKGLGVGQQARVTREFTAEDVAGYRALTGDAGLEFGRRPSAGQADMVPGPLIGGLFSYLLGTQLPGRGTNWLKQRLYFPRPALVGETLTASVTITRLRPEKHLVNLRTACMTAYGELVCEGEALVLVKDLETSE